MPALDSPAGLRSCNDFSFSSLCRVSPAILLNQGLLAFRAAFENISEVTFLPLNGGLRCATVILVAFLQLQYVQTVHANSTCRWKRMHVIKPIAVVESDLHHRLRVTRSPTC